MTAYPPYYIVPSVEALATAGSPAEEKLLRRRIALHVGDAEVLRRLFGMTEIDTDSFYPSPHPDLSTEATIDSFLARFGGNGGGVEAMPTEAVPMTPAVDYLTLLSLEEKQGDAGNDVGDIEASVEAEEEEISEETAKLLIKKGNYKRAHQIIEALSLKNPEKSIYFADQLRFLRKLMLLSGAAGR